MTRHQGKTKDATLLTLAFIMAKITSELDREGLIKHIRYCSANLYDQEFFKLFKITLSILEHKTCKKLSCEDWLVTQLYSIYHAEDHGYASFFSPPV